MTRRTIRTIARQLKQATTPADFLSVIQAIDALPADPRLTELRGRAVIAKTNRVQQSVAVLQEARNARLGA